MRRKLLLLFLTSVVGLAACEIGLRLLHLAPPTLRAYVGEFENGPLNNFVVDPFTGWCSRPNHEFVWKIEGRDVVYRSDARGRRIGEQAGPDHGSTLLAAGDSFGFGIGVTHEESFAARIADQLGGWKLENIAMPGYGLDQIWLSIREALKEETPDLLLVGLYPKDFDRSLTAYRELERLNKPLFRLEGGELRLQAAADRPSSLMLWLERSSRLVSAYRSADRRLGWKLGIGEWWSLNRAFLDAIRAECDQAGCPVLFLFLPSNRWQRFPALEEYMQACGANFVNPIQISPDRPDGAFFQSDPHFTTKGHALVADWTTAWIEEHRGKLLRK
ncbi:MAG: hypothetical protein V2A76_01815 [Planctomycetota bacterium]